MFVGKESVELDLFVVWVVPWQQFQQQLSSQDLLTGNQHLLGMGGGGDSVIGSWFGDVFFDETCSGSDSFPCGETCSSRGS